MKTFHQKSRQRSTHAVTALISQTTGIHADKDKGKEKDKEKGKEKNKDDGKEKNKHKHNTKKKTNKNKNKKTMYTRSIAMNVFLLSGIVCNVCSGDSDGGFSKFLMLTHRWSSSFFPL